MENEGNSSLDNAGRGAMIAQNVERKYFKPDQQKSLRLTLVQKTKHSNFIFKRKVEENG